MTHTVFREFAWLPAAVGLFGAVLRRPMITSMIAVAIASMTGALFESNAGTASQIHFPAKFGLALFLFALGRKFASHLISTLDPVPLVRGLCADTFTVVSRR